MSATTTIEYLTAWATLGTAFATLALAVGTFYMAAKTRDEASATREDVDASKEQIAVALQQVELSRRQADAAELAASAQLRPLLVAGKDLTRKDSSNRDRSVLHARVMANQNMVVIDLAVRNVGAGVARITSVELEADITPLGYTVNAPAPDVAAGEQVRIELVSRAAAVNYDALVDVVTGERAFVVAISYTDAAGGQPTVTRATMAVNRDSGSWRIQQVKTTDPARSSEPVRSMTAFS